MRKYYAGSGLEPAMNVALFTDSDAFSGTERHILDLAMALPATGVQATIACPAASPLAQRAEAANVPVVPVEKHGLVDVGAVRALRALMREGRVDLIHAHNGRTTLNSALAACLERGFPCVATQHFLAPDHTSRKGPAAMLHRMAHLYVNRQLRGLIAISEAVRGEMVSRRDAAPQRITVVPNGANAPQQSTLTPAEQIRRELGISEDAPLVACVARLEPEKDIGSLVSAFAAVSQRHPEAQCVIAGEGSLRADLDRDIADKGLRQSVRLLGFRSDAVSIINAADVFVLPSLAEPFGLVLLEAMALGKAIVATRAGGPREIVEEGRTGVLVPPASPAELAGALSDLIGDPKRRDQMGSQGRDRFQTHFTAERMARDMAAAYRRALCH
jgi:glycosyltransferase involved in cell wall biosynthesis